MADTVTAKFMSAILLLAASVGAVAGQSRRDDPQVNASNTRFVANDRRAMSLDEAANMVQARFHARVVRAESHDAGGKLIYRFKLLTDDGRVFTVQIDAATGRILE
jgi:uncharacterized membrane protein YkoI